MGEGLEEFRKLVGWMRSRLAFEPFVTATDLSRWRESQRYELRFWATEWNSELLRKGTDAVIAHRLEDGRWLLSAMQILFEASTLESSVFRGEILEVGCGPVGFFETWPGVQVVGCDPLMAQYAATLSCSHLGARANYLYTDTSVQEISRSFDFVVFSNVLDHVENWRFVAYHMVRLCKVGGSLLLFTHCRSEPVEGHLQTFTPGQVRSFLEALGMKVILYEHRPGGDAIELFLRATRERAFGRSLMGRFARELLRSLGQPSWDHEGLASFPASDSQGIKRGKVVSIRCQFGSH